MMKLLIDSWFKDININELISDNVMLYMFLNNIHKQIDTYMDGLGLDGKVDAYMYVGKLLYKD